MHGRPRKPQFAVDAAAATANASKLQDLQSQLIHNHHLRLYTNEAISVCSKLLEINPEINTAWNYRKFAFQHNLHETTNSEHIKSLVEDELRVVEMALRENPKSYGAWYHRKWIFSQGLADVDFDREFLLLDQLLQADSRNFHGWNYRRFVSKLKDVPDPEELEVSKDMVMTNFSNYSVWHNRSVLLSRLLNNKAEGFIEREGILTKEYGFVHDALAAGSKVQSGWFYHLCLLHQTITPNEISLISSWPPHESALVLSANRDTGYYFTNTRKLPIVLYFNQTVKGVNSSSVIVNSMLFKNEDLVWKPLPPTKSEKAACWVTYLQFPDMKSWVAKVYVIEVKIDHSEAIISSCSGSRSIHPLNYRFTFSLNYDNLEFAESIDELLDWTDVGSLGVESNDLVSFDQSKSSEDLVSGFSKWQMQTISGEINLIETLFKENCKFDKLTLARLLIAHDAMLSHKTPVTEREIHFRDVLELFDDLVKLDPKHSKYYEDEKSLVLMNQVTIDKKSFSNHCSSSSNYISSKLHLHGCMQLRNLSLTRIGYVERLLWVQVLDLSYNKLRSIEGIEALQLLTCLNLRNNHICSFTALQPLKLLSYLKVLDISFNDIGAHPVDTARYLFSSPSTRSVELDKEFLEDYCRSKVDITNNWEAICLFRDLQLHQLDVKNNAVADTNFRDLLTKVLPTLMWLDGEQLR
ncbi:hypothetical protein KSP40_PGU006990 [Platanthera guangdongensis]|uniref:Geranylgeranyl transferase type-2 subunit alpha n=1 Tax=Platanthera guangdongensis TaxID=2320717 RepID=A0ABR2MCD5_9ASPA